MMDGVKPANAEGPLARAVEILETVAASGRTMPIAMIADALHLAPATAHRLVGNLEELGLLGRMPGSKRITLGPRLIELAFHTVTSAFSNPARHAILQGLADQIGEQCELGVVRENSVVYVDSVRRVRGASLQFVPGSRAPLHCTSTGKLFLSRLPTKIRVETVRALPLPRFTDHTITDPDLLLAELERVRQQGWASNNEEFVVGVVGCAVPVLNSKQKLLAGLGLTVPIARVGFDALVSFIPALREAAARLAASLNDDD